MLNNIFKFFLRCKKFRQCEYYDIKLVTCNNTMGDYYGLGRKCGKYRDMEENDKIR